MVVEGGQWHCTFSRFRRFDVEIVDRLMPLSSVYCPYCGRPPQMITARPPSIISRAKKVSIYNWIHIIACLWNSRTTEQRSAFSSILLPRLGINILVDTYIGAKLRVHAWSHNWINVDPEFNHYGLKKRSSGGRAHLPIRCLQFDYWRRFHRWNGAWDRWRNHRRTETVTLSKILDIFTRFLIV